MALTPINTPSYSGTLEQAMRSAGHLASQVFHRPVWDEIVFEQTKKYWLSFLLGKVGGTKDIEGRTWNWVEKGPMYAKKTRHATTAPVEDSAGVFTITLNEATPYFTVSDIVDLGSVYQGAGSTGFNQLARVIDVPSAGVIQVDINPFDGGATVGTFGISDLPANHQISLVTTAVAECFTKPEPRMFTPEKKTGNIQVIPTAYSICDQAARQPLWFKGKKSGKNFWLDQEDLDQAEEHNRLADNAVLYGLDGTWTESGTTYDGYTTLGILPFLGQQSLSFSYSGAVIEDDLLTFIAELSTYAKNKEWFLFQGITQFKDTQKALKDYVVAGAQSFGGFSADMASKAGINIGQYSLGGMKLNLVNYDGFSDPNFLPQNSTGVIYKNFGMCLDVSMIKIVYQKNRNGQRLKSWFDEWSGPTMTASHRPTSQKACIDRQWTTALGCEIKGANSHGLLIGD